MKTTKVLITGAGGFLGSYIAKLMSCDSEYEIFSFSRSHYPELESMNIEQRHGDLKNYEDVKRALIGMDAVIHTASKVGMCGRFEDFYSTNVTGTKNIIRAMEELGIKKLVYTSTPSVAFGHNDLCGVDESTPYPKTYLNHYASTKSMAEQIVLAANGVGLSTVSLRPHLIFGPGDQNLIPRVIEAKRSGRLKIIGNGENLVDVTYVENAAFAHILALKKLSATSPIAGKAYFLGQGPLRLWDFTNEILKRAGLAPVTKKIPLPLAYFIGFLIENFYKLKGEYDIQPPMTRFVALQLGKSHYFSHKNLETDLGYTPHISIEEGLNRLFQSSHY